ncbi:MAG TPA: hypothetical protein VGS41_13520 [Chthonomonadales bacterium]|nr:hypothetical protein [Chthonomonadales bacterium]
MSTHNEHGPKPEEIDASLGYEQSDVRATGIIVFLTAFSIFVAVVAITAYGVGKATDMWIAHSDPKPNHWTKTVDIRELGNMPSDPAMQQKMAALVNQLPTPRLQSDGGDGAMDLMSLHQREDLLLDHYTWVNQQKQTVRIPLDRAMEIVAQQGLPVAPAAVLPALMTGDARPKITEPLTDGFARTGYEQDQAHSLKAAARQEQ